MHPHQPHVSWGAPGSEGPGVSIVTCVCDLYILRDAFRTGISRQALRTFPSNQTWETWDSPHPLEPSLSGLSRVTIKPPGSRKSHNPLLS